MSADMLSAARNLFDRMSVCLDDERANCFMKSIIFEGDAAAAGGADAAGYDPEEIQSQDIRGPFTPSTYDQAGMQAAFMQDLVGLDMDGFPLDYLFLEDYDLEEEDELDIGREPLFEELANQAAVRVKPKRKRRRTKAHYKLWRPSRFNTKASPSTSLIVGGSSKMRKSSRRNMPPPGAWGEGSRGGGWGGRDATITGKTNSKKEDKRDATSVALIATMDGMMTKKDSRQEKCRQYKEEQMNAFMEFQRRRLEMEAEKQVKMLEMEAEKQAKMLEIKAANAKTKAEEVALAIMMMGGEHEGGSQHRVAKEEAVVRENAGRHAQVRRRVIYGGGRHPFLYAGKCASMTTAAMAFA
ncbi:Eyes absent-like protein 4 [Hordeum vulgare]|nr:Eyes absent-like protein 4 [Hordeum vulgare]